jgi:ribonuclease VapC
VILDTSALAAIFFGEPEEEEFSRLILKSRPCRMSAANFVELSFLLESEIGPEASRQCDAFFTRTGIVIEPVTVDQAYLARQAFVDFGKGRHPAKLNFGDCFSYALSKATGESLLFKGNDFGKTDIAIVK